MNVRSIGIASSFLVAAFAVACGGSSRRSGFGLEADPTVSPDGGAGEKGPGGFGGENTPDPGDGSDCAVNNVETDMEKDFDGDGYALKDDCNECNTSINRGAHDIPGNGVDEDCSGTPDDEEVDCDANLSIDTGDPFDGAKAIGLCKKADPKGRDWGVVEATWVKPDGKPIPNDLGYGVLPSFGVNAPQSGASMLALSSGFARAPGDPGYKSGISQDKGYTSGAPSGYPKESPACPGVHTGGPTDGAGLKLKIRVPSNAKSFSYQQFFFTYEYPTYICTQFNDFFVTMMSPVPASLPDGNIAFDQDGNPISVNNSLLQVCKSGNHGGRNFPCPLGTSLLSGTGFENAGATGWLTTTSPVEPGKEIDLLFTIWDSGDHSWDSTVLIDDFKFSIEEAETTRTTPSPVN